MNRLNVVTGSLTTTGSSNSILRVLTDPVIAAFSLVPLFGEADEIVGFVKRRFWTISSIRLGTSVARNGCIAMESQWKKVTTGEFCWGLFSCFFV